jgi:hypothetical protein
LTPVPVPVRVALCGLPAALSETERVPDREPIAPGRNVTLMVQLAPAAKVVPQVVVSAKSEAFVPAIETLLMVMVPVPVFFSVTVLALVVTFTGWIPNATVVGVTLATGVVPVPVKLTCCGLLGSESAIRSVAVLLLLAVGVNVTLMLQLAPTANVLAQVLV